MKTKSNHTPTPWTLGYKDKQCIYSGYKQIAVVQCRLNEWTDNAAFIVKACNSHDENQEDIKNLEEANEYLKKQAGEWRNLNKELVEACRQALTQIKPCEDENGTCIRNEVACDKCRISFLLKQALAKAEGRE